MEKFQCLDCGENVVCIEKLHTNPFSKLSLEDKTKILAFNRPTPDLPRLTKKKCGEVVIHFTPKYYEHYSWLTGCRHANALFCFPCLLFSSFCSVWNDRGFADLNNYSTLAKNHDQSENHIQACLAMISFHEKCIEMSISVVPLKENIEHHNSKVDCNRNVFYHLIDVVCFLAKQELPFFAQDNHDEVESSKSNFMEMVNLLAKYDGVLNNHLQMSTNSLIDCSEKIQNDLISALASFISRDVKSQISKADFVSIIIEQTPGVDSVQLVLILRYFYHDELVHRFLGFIDFSSVQSAEALSKIILDTLENYICTSKLVAQSYDSVSSFKFMSGENKVEELVREKCPHGLYVWCSSHILNFVLSKSCEQVFGTKRFFGFIKLFNNFFSNNNKRLTYYYQYIDIKIHPSAAPTCWNYNYQTVNIISDKLDHFTEIFDNIVNDSVNWDGDTLLQADTLLLTLKDFQFNFFLKVFSEIFKKSKYVYNFLQTEIGDTEACMKRINCFENFLNRFINDFDSIFFFTQIKCGPPKRKRGIDNLKMYYKAIFRAIIDNILLEVHNRFDNIKNLSFLQLLNQKNYIKYTSCFPDICLNNFKEIYGSFNFNFDRLRNELNCIYRSEAFKDLNPLEIIDYLSKNNKSQLFPEIIRLAKLIVTIPIGDSSPEKYFSCIKTIQTYLRKTQGQKLTNDISLISIEKDILLNLKRSQTFYKEVLDIYLEKDKRDDLIYK